MVTGLSAIKSWFNLHLESLGYEEHVDGFNTDNIGELDLDMVYHYRPLAVVGGPINHTDQPTETEVELKVFLKGGRNASEAIDNAIMAIEDIVKECCNIKSRTSDGILNVIFDRVEIEPRAADNDNSVLLTFDFSVRVQLGVEE